MAPIHQLCNTITSAYARKAARICVHDTKAFRSMIDILYKEGLVNGYQVKPVDTRIYPVLNQVAGLPLTASPPVDMVPPYLRRIWVDLKYRQGLPVLREMKLISKPSRHIYASVDELKAIVTCRNSGTLLKGQVLGQVTMVETPYGILEIKDAIRKNVGGKVLCYAV